MTRNLHAGVKAVILDIEGTVTPHAYTEETLIPYVRENITDYIWDYEFALAEHLDAVREQERNPYLTNEEVIQVLLRYLEEGEGSASLRAIQELVLAEGYNAGKLQTPIYEDALRAFKRWHDQRISIYTFSGHSRAEQSLLFTHTQAGDVNSTFDGLCDAREEEKTLSETYKKIAAFIGLKTSEVLFLTSDIDDAVTASNADMNVIIFDRQVSLENTYGHRVEHSFDSILPETVPA